MNYQHFDINYRSVFSIWYEGKEFDKIQRLM
jgi:hypothetical protein